MTDTKIGFIITYFHSSEEGLQLLIQNLKTLSKENYYLILASHSPLDKSLQEMCDFYFYQQKNIVDDRKYSHGVAESNLMEICLKHLKDVDINWTYKATYDIEIKDINQFKKWKKEGYKFVSCNWGNNIICTNSFFSNIDFLLENITFYKTIDEMFYVNNVLENCWEFNFRKNNVLDNIYSFGDKYEFYGPNKIDICFYDYNKIEFWYSENENVFYIKTSEDLDFNLEIYDYYTDLCLFKRDLSLSNDIINWVVPPFSDKLKLSKNGFYCEIKIDNKIIRKNILIKDFEYKHKLNKKLISYKNEKLDFLYGYLNDFEEIYNKLNLTEIRNFVDLGANYGIASIFFIERDVKTYLIDADTRMVKILESNFGKNSNNKIIDKAIYKIDGEIEFYEDSDCSMISSINSSDQNNKIKKIVSCITPNNLIENYIDEDFIDLIKIDIEGAEYELFETITDVNLSKISNLLIEYHDNENYRVLEIIKRLTMNNYKFKFISEGYPIESRGGLIYACK